MAKEPPVLVVGGQAHDRLSSKLLGLGFRALRAIDPDEAQERLDGAGDRVHAALVEGSMDASVIRAIGKLSPNTQLFAIGPRPDDDQIRALRTAGVQIGLFDPVEDGVLQFCLGQAALAGRGIEGRRHGRVPTDLTAVVRAKTGPRTAGIHEMSTSGAYLTTLRPLMNGAVIPIELRLPDREIATEATVVWSNVIGNLRRDRHPTGMAVKFGPLTGEDAEAIGRYLADKLDSFRL